jgi:membrane associated rhomboid family serine protease
VIALAAKFYSDHRVFDETQLSPALLHDPSGWWRLVAALFVHGEKQVLPCIAALSLLWSLGTRAERAFGSGAALFIFIVGGATANLARCAAESESWLQIAGTGTIPGAIALAGAWVSGAVRTRESGLARSLAVALGSSAFAVFFASTPELGVGLGAPLLRFLPSAGVAFVLGGLLGSAAPLRTNASARPVRVILLAIALVILAVSGFALNRRLDSAASGVDAPTKKKSVPVVEHDDPELGLTYDVPIYLARFHLDENGQGRISGFRPAFKRFPVLLIHVIPRGDYFDAEGRALQLADMERAEDPTAKRISDGKVECPLGPAYHVGLVVSHEGEEFSRWHCFVTPTASSESTIWIELYAESDGENALQTIESVARSLKLRAGRADKGNDAKRSDRPR